MNVISWEKNAFSYLLWFFYTLTTGVILVCISVEVCVSRGLPEYVGCAFVVGYTAAVGLAVFLIRRLCVKRQGAADLDRGVRLALELCAVAVLLAAGLLLRVRGVENAGQQEAYFEAVKITAGQELPQAANRAMHLYLRALHMLFAFLGNKVAAGLWFQILLQMTGAAVLYFVLRRMAGVLPALTVLGFLMYAPFLVRRSLAFSPEMLYFLFFTAALGCVAGGYAYRGMSRSGLFLLFGVLAAVMTYLDVTGALLFLFALAVIFARRQERVEVVTRALAVFLCLLGFLAGFAGSALVDARLSGRAVGEVFGAWFSLYGPKSFSVPVSVGYGAEEAENLILAGLMVFGVFGFWCDKKSDRLGVGALFAGVLLSADCFGMISEEIPIAFYLYLLFALLAGTGLSEVFRVVPAEAYDGAEQGLSGEEFENIRLEEESPAGKKSREGSPAGKKSREGSPAGKKSEEESPAGKKSREGSPAGKKSEEGSPAGKKSKEGKPEDGTLGVGKTEAGKMKERKPEERKSEKRESKERQPEETRPEERGSKENQPKQGKPEGKPEDKQSDEEGGRKGKLGEDAEKRRRPIENPLPLPKKHEKRRALDFDIKVAEDADFDYAVKDEDDFDI